MNQTKPVHFSLLLLARYLVTGKGKQPTEPAPKSALLSSPSHPPTPHSTICPLFMHGHWWRHICIGIWYFNSSSKSQPSLPLASMSHPLWLLPSCENSLLTSAPMAVDTWFSLHHYRWFLPCAKSVSLMFSKVCTLALPLLYTACLVLHTC